MAASTQSPRPVQDGLSIRPTRVELRSNEVAGDIRKVMSHPLPGLPMYKHLVPRVPAGIKDRWAVLIFCCSPRLSYIKSLFFFFFPPTNTEWNLVSRLFIHSLLTISSQCCAIGG